MNISDTRLQVFMAMKIHISVFWFVTLHSDMVGWRQHGPLKQWYPTISLHDVTTHKTATLMNTSVT